MEESFSKFGPFIGILLELALLALGILLIRKHTKSKRKATEALNWPKALGRVTHSEILRSESSDEDGTSYSYTPHIEYEYQVSGQNYCNKQVVFGGFSGTSSKKPAEKVVYKYPLNDSVSVYYNPANPNEAVLEQNVGSGAKGALIGGIILIVVSLLMVLPLLLAWFG
ncbi:MAG TPA: DUF3592 domain-containing protein [Anaerolineaceae bacterium]|nr:DUF3592 domain-containing protein [Anaerolineaceae bacterium]